MPSRIESMTVGGVEDKRLLLNNSGAARAISIGDDWDVLRMGFRMAFTDRGITLGASHLYMGLMSNPNAGLTNGPLGLTTGHFAGWTTKRNGVDESGWERVSSGGFIYYNSVNTSQTTKIGNTVVDGAAAQPNYSTNPLRRQIFIIEFTKGTPWTTEMIHPTGFGTSGQVDIPSIGLVTDCLEISTMNEAVTFLDSAISPDAYLTTTPRNMNVDELTNGVLNALVVAWNRSSVSCIISEMCWAKKS
jgi:hypothetical protein